MLTLVTAALLPFGSMHATLPNDGDGEAYTTFGVPPGSSPGSTHPALQNFSSSTSPSPSPTFSSSRHLQTKPQRLKGGREDPRRRGKRDAAAPCVVTTASDDNDSADTTLRQCLEELNTDGGGDIQFQINISGNGVAGCNATIFLKTPLPPITGKLPRTCRVAMLSLSFCSLFVRFSMEGLILTE